MEVRLVSLQTPEDVKMYVFDNLMCGIRVPENMTPAQATKHRAQMLTLQESFLTHPNPEEFANHCQAKLGLDYDVIGLLQFVRGDMFPNNPFHALKECGRCINLAAENVMKFAYLNSFNPDISGKFNADEIYNGTAN